MPQGCRLVGIDLGHTAGRLPLWRLVACPEMQIHPAALSTVLSASAAGPPDRPAGQRSSPTTLRGAVTEEGCPIEGCGV